IALVMQNNSAGPEQERAVGEVAVATLKANAVDKGMAIVKPFIPGHVVASLWFIRALIKAQYFDQAIEIAEMHGIGDLRDGWLQEIAPKVAEKEPHRAMAIVESISNPRIKAATRAEIASKMCP
ncbi:MAG TPA: hypothetical protein DF383_10625, partial [Deltaproteobacteria bacterium]|nr:hypothetical protein [Deltaproteobacteria bacterium]